MAKWKMIGIRVPEESDLPARLKGISEKTRLSYCELLEKLITQAELNPNTPEPGIEAKDIIALQALAEKFSDLRLQVHEIGARLKILEKNANPEKDNTNSYQASEASAAASLKRAQETDGSEQVSEIIEEKSESEGKAATITYIRRLSAEGLSLRKIAERLKSEAIPTLSGSGVWHHETVRKVLAKCLNELNRLAT